jgi:hypothetical protein
VFPVSGILIGWRRSGRPDILGVLTLFFIGLSLAVAVAVNDPMILLLRGSVRNAAFALLCFGSLALARPLMFYVARQFAAGWDQVAMLHFDAQWEYPGFRRAMRQITLAWGCWLLAEAVVRVPAALLLPVSTFLATWPAATTVGTLAMMYWSMTHVGRAAGRTPWLPDEYAARLSERGWHALEQAGEEARRLNRDYIGTEHLLLALFGDEGAAARVLGDLGVTLEAMRAALDAAVAPGRVPSPREIGYAPRLRAAIGRGVDAYRATGASQIGTKHLLFGLAAVEDGLAAVLLTRLGVDLADLRERLVGFRDLPPGAPLP